ncbi:MAG: TRAP transporter large permease subunit [Deltaproteobacteria bacterium]|nr:TRAP transporter large permease subunit [Deltaproteobacteria bacterium]
MSGTELLGLVMLGCLLIGIFGGFPISFTLLFLAIGFGYAGIGDKVFYLIVSRAFTLMKDETMAAVPLFIFMGHMLEESGLMARLFKSFQFMLARMKGSLYLGVILTCTLFAAATGIIGAATTVIGLLAAPAMTKSGYSPSLSAGAIAAGGCLGILIPPSVMLVVMGPVLGVSVIHLFAAALIPGLILSLMFIGYTLVRCQINPELGPPLPPELRPESTRAIFKELISGVIPLGFVMFASLGSIIAGLATPTEAAAMGAGGALLLTIIYKRFSLRLLKASTLSTLRTTSLILFLVVASTQYGAVFTVLGTGSMLVKTMMGLPVSPMVLLAILMVVIFLLGWPLEWPAILFIFVPIFLPVIIKLNFDLVWFGTLLAVNLQTAFLSPPVAMSAYYLKAVAPEWSLADIYIGMMQFMVLQFVGLMLVFFLPQIALWLPGVLYG